MIAEWEVLEAPAGGGHFYISTLHALSSAIVNYLYCHLLSEKAEDAVLMIS